MLKVYTHKISYIENRSEVTLGLRINSGSSAVNYDEFYFIVFIFDILRLTGDIFRFH